VAPSPGSFSFPNLSDGRCWEIHSFEIIEWQKIVKSKPIPIINHWISVGLFLLLLELIAILLLPKCVHVSTTILLPEIVS